MLNKILFCIGILSGVVLLILLNTTTPSSAGPLGMLIVFVSIYAVIVVALSLAIQLFSKLATTTKTQNQSSPAFHISPKRAYYFASILAFAPLVILVSESFGGGIVGWLAAFILAVVGCVFAIKK